MFVTDIHGDGPPVNTWGNITADSTLTMYSLAAYEDAVCNGARPRYAAQRGARCAVMSRSTTDARADGSPAAYYFAPGSGDMVNEWLVYLEGR